MVQLKCDKNALGPVRRLSLPTLTEVLKRITLSQQAKVSEPRMEYVPGTQTVACADNL